MLEPILTEILRATIGVVAVFVALVCFRVGYLIFAGDPNEYEENRRRIGPWKNNFRGTVPTLYDVTRSDKVAAGIAIDVKTNQWVEQGRLSDEALRDALHHG